MSYLRYKMYKGIKNIALLCFIAIFFFSCSEKGRNVSKTNKSVQNIFDSAKYNKGVILVSNTEACSLCDDFKKLLKEDGAIAKYIYENFVIGYVNYNIVGEEWLVRILNRMAFPIFLFFDSQQRLIGLEYGVFEPSLLSQFVECIQESKRWIDTDTQIDGIPKEKLLDYLEYTIHAQYFWDKFRETNNPKLLELMNFQLEKSIMESPSMYNHYLWANVLKSQGRLDSAIIVAKKALQFPTARGIPNDLALKGELNKLINNTSFFEDAYIEVSGENEQDIGQIPINKQKSVKFLIKNIGKKELILDSVYFDCGCLIVECPKRRLKYNDTAVVRIVIAPKIREAFNYIVNIKSNALNNPLSFSINGSGVERFKQ